MELYNENEVRNITNNGMNGLLLEEITKCVPYSWILINHYQLKKHISDKKYSKKQLEEIMIPFEVEIKDKKHPHVYIRKDTNRICYKKKLATYKNPVTEIEFEDGGIVILNLHQIEKLVFNKSCTLNYKTRMLSDSTRREKSSSIIIDLNHDRNASIIRNSSEVDCIMKNVYAETVFKLTYIGKEENRPEWLYPYPQNAVDSDVLKNDLLKLIQGMQRQTSTNKDSEKYSHLIYEGYKRR